MIEFVAKIPEVLVDFSGNGKVVFTVDRSKLATIGGLPKDKDLDVCISIHRNKRSTEANAYCWHLVTEIADAVGAAKDEVYMRMLKRYGQSCVISVKSEIDMTGMLKYYEERGTSVLNGTEFTHYTVYKGSSEYNTKEMAVFLDGIISEAQELGIDTRTPDEVAKMEALWNNE